MINFCITFRIPDDPFRRARMYRFADRPRAYAYRWLRRADAWARLPY